MDITRFIVSQRDKALLVGDNGSYRKQLSRRLLVVRKKLNCSSKGRKYTPKSPITAEDIASNHEYVHLLLLTAERAWALAMYMKATHAADSNTQGTTGSTKRHIVSKLQRASSYAAHLVTLLQDTDKSGASTESILEARAYQQSLQGAIKFEKKAWEQCLQSYSETRLLYIALARSVGTKQDDVFKDLLAGTIDQSMRYAAYQLKLPRTISLEMIVARYVQRADNRYVAEALKSNPDLLLEPGLAAKKDVQGELADTPKAITWRSRTVKLEDATTAQALASVSAAESKLASFLDANQDVDRRAKAAAFDDVLIPSQDAVDAVKTAIDELTAEGVSQGDSRMQSLQITRTAVNYNLVEWRVGRNRVLCGEQDGATFESQSVKQPKKPRADGKPRVAQEESTGRKLTRLREMVVLYDSTLQSLDSVKGFPGVAADQPFLNEIHAKKAYFSSLRCLAIARSHTLHGNKRNALALLAHAAELSSRAMSSSPPAESATEGIPKLEIDPAQARSLKDFLDRSVLQYRALVELEDLKSETSKQNAASRSPPMIERLDEYPAEGVVDLTNLVTYPPKLQLIPVKPIFLDTAWNYIDYPGRPKKGTATALDGEAEETPSRAEPKKEAKKGWFGFGR
ncbi:signal recognition particle subunit srp68 [Xanthoria calcicola]